MWRIICAQSQNSPGLVGDVIGLGSQGKEWSQEEKFDRISEAGFTGVLGTSAELMDGSRWVELANRHK